MAVAFTFPGQGSQAVGMGKDLADAFPEARRVFEEVDEALGEKLSTLIWEGPEETLTLTANAQPALMAVSLAAMRVLSRWLGRRVGGSTGTNFAAMCFHAARMASAGEAGSLVTLICDSGERYANTYYSDAWLAQNDLDPSPFEPRIEAFLAGGKLDLEFEESRG